MNRLYSRRDILKLGGYAIATMMAPGILNVKAKENANKVNEDAYDETLDLFGSGAGFFEFITTIKFNYKAKPVDEVIKTPDEITEELLSEGREKLLDRYEKKGYIKELNLNPTDSAPWIAVAHKSVQGISPYVVAVDRDGDGKGEELYPTADVIWHFDWVKKIEDHIKRVPPELQKKGAGEVIINLYDWTSAPDPEELSPPQKILYTLDLEKIGTPVEAYHFEEVTTPREIGLTKIGKDVYETPTPGKTRENGMGTEKPTESGSEEGVNKSPGVGVLGAAAGGTVAWIIEKYMSRKK